MKIKFRRLVIFLFVLLVSLLTFEFFLRSYFGFCDAVLLKDDSDFEYIAFPKQDRFRFRNHIKYNSFSMRSLEIDSTSINILGFGDSILNGGVQTDQDELATTILTDALSKIKGKNVQFLNISAGSWGPDNSFAYLNKYGDFNAHAIYLFVSSHDAYDNMNFKKIIDINKSFPSKQYHFAIIELLDRYILPRLIGLSNNKENELLVINKKEAENKFNSGFESFYIYSTDNKLPLTIYLHADKEECVKGKYNEQGQEIIQFAKEKNIKIILDLENGLELSDFRDDIHINAKGQKNMAKIILESMK